jgi:hypothetical protein
MHDVQFRHGTAAAWTTSARVLAKGEPGYETDTGKIKVGDGSTAWASLAYVTAGAKGDKGDKGDTGATYVPASASAANVGDLAHAINTTGKVVGGSVFVTDTHATLFAGGSTAASHWYTAAGVDTITPA